MNFEIKDYYNQLAATYDTNRFENSYGKFIDLQERAFLNKSLINLNNVLDLGCGTGRLLNFANYGVDFSENMIEIAQKKFINKKIVLGNLTEIPFENLFFDCIFCFHVVMHLDVKTTTDFLVETNKKLTINGKLIFDFPSKKRRKLFNFKSKNWHGANSFSIDEIELLIKNQYKITKTQGVLFLPIHRFPVFLRPFILKMDSFLCQSFLKEYASYVIVELEKI